MTLDLPSREEIQTMRETRVAGFPSLIRKEIRYKDGIILTLYQDLGGHIFRVSVESRIPFRFRKNQILNTGVESA